MVDWLLVLNALEKQGHGMKGACGRTQNFDFQVKR